MPSTQETVFSRCQRVFPEWRALPIDAFTFADPKGFSSFTMAIQTDAPVAPPAVLYRQLAGKENAILDFDQERAVFLLLGAHEIAAHCYHYDATCRIEAFYHGRTLTRHDLSDHDTLRAVAAELYRFHQLQPADLPSDTFFERLHDRWGPIARAVLVEHRGAFDPDEQALCDALRPIYSEATLAKVRRCLPPGAPVFCHNDTYHGNIMRLDSGTIKLLDFEFSCLNHPAFDFANLFAETVMRHGLAEPPHFSIAEPEYAVADIAVLVDAYLSHATFPSADARRRRREALIQATLDMIPLSDYMYAMAALPLALQPIQKIRFIPYAHARFNRFLRAYAARFPTG